jgi:ABC-type glycerol-3-phosphate transport system substrate-binding protein
MYELTRKKGYTPIIFPVPNLKGSKDITVTPAIISAINKNSRSKKAAYLFIEMVINQNDVFERVNNYLDLFYGVPINNKYLENSKTSYTETIYLEHATVYKYSDSFINSYLNIIKNIKDCRLEDNYIYFEIMQGIIIRCEKENLTYEEAVKIAQEELEAYRAEPN